MPGGSVPHGSPLPGGDRPGRRRNRRRDPMKKRFLSCFMALALCLTLLPAAALAEETEGTAQTPPAVEKAADPANGGAKQESQPAAPEQERQPAEQEEQQEDSASKQAVAAVQAMIDALPDAEALDGMDDEDAMAVYEAFQNACEAYYETLTEEQQAQLKNTEKLAALSGWFSQSAALAEGTEVEIQIDGVNDIDGTIEKSGGIKRKGPKLTADLAKGTLSGKYYIVEKNMTINGDLTVDGHGDGGLVLCDGATLTVNGALIHNGGNAFYIYGQTLAAGSNGTGKLVINNSDGKDAAIRSASKSAPRLGISRGEVTIISGASNELVSNVELYSTRPVHAAALDDEKVLPAKWSGVSSITGTSLVLAYCDHDNATYVSANQTQHTKRCPDCGFVGTAKDCGADGVDGYVSDGANGHYQKCPCGNKFGEKIKHTIVTAPTNDGKKHTSMCGICGYTPESGTEAEHSYDENGQCTVCQFQPILQGANGNLYDDLATALYEGETALTLVSYATGDANKGIVKTNLEFDRNATITLDMGGCTLENSTGDATITVASGTLTVKGEATIKQTGTGESASPAVRVTGGELIFTGALTATGASGKPAVEVTGGTLRLKAGDVLNGGVSVAGSTAYANVNALLGDGLAFAKEDEHSIIIVNGNVKSIDENVVVKEHGHSFTLGSDGKYTCVCGCTCPHNDFKDGKCTVCHNGCVHTNVDENGVCENCKTQMAVKSETGGTVTYGTDFKAAMKAAENGTTVKLLADVSISGRPGISGDNTTVTLDLNGHKITSGWLDVGGKDTNGTYTACTLKIIGKGSYEPPMYGGMITVDMKATLDLSEWEGGTISSINISDNSNYEAATREAAVIVGPKAGTIGKLAFGNNQLDKLKKTKLSGGKFNEIWVAGFGPVKLGELLAEGYAYQKADGSYVEYGRTLQGASIYNVKVVPCPHADAEGGKCLYCGQTGILARVGDTTYGSVSDAVTAWMNVGGTLTLFDDYGEGFDANALDLISAKAKGLAIDLNGHGFYKDCQGDIKLGGGKALTITDSSSKGTGVFGPVTADRGTLTLESGHLQGLKVFSGSEPTILLWGGKLTGISCPVPVFNLLPNGYALMDDSGLPVDPTITIDDSKTYTVKDSTNRCISSQKEGSAAIGSDTIPFTLSLETADSEIGKMGFTWYIVKEDGTTQKLAATTSDVTPGTNGVYTCNAANMTGDPNGWTDLEVNKTYNVLCVVSGKTSDGTSKWQTPMRGYKLQTLPPSLENAEIRFADGGQERTFWPDPDNHSVGKIEILSGLGLYTVTLGGKTLVEGTDYQVISGNVATGIGTYDLTIEGIAPNYSGTKTAQWTVVPFSLGTYKISPNKKQYDGTVALPDGVFPGRFDPRSPYLSDITLREGTDYVVTDARFDTPYASNENKAYRYTVELKNPNYVFANGTKVQTWVYGVDVNATIEITKADAPAAREGALEVINNHADTYTVDLAALLPKLESPKEYGEVAYALDANMLESAYYAVGTATIENGRLILPIKAVETKETGSIGSVKVKVSTTNYHDFTLTINVNAANKIVPTGAPTLSKTTLAWGEQLSTITLSGAMKDGDTEVKGTFAWTNSATTPSDMNDFEAEWKFTPENTDVYAEITDTVTIKVIKATPTGAPKYTAINASGKTLADAALAVNEAWPEGTVQWVDENGVELDVSAEVKANTAYRWRFVPTDTEHYNEASGAITLYTVSHSGGGGSSSGSSDNNPIIKTETKNNADGSTTKTETKKDGTVIETTTGKDGSVSKTETKPDGSSVTENKAADGSTGTVKTDKNGQTTAETKISAKAVEDAKKNGEAVKAPVEVKASRNSNTAPTVKVELPKGTGETKVEIPVSNVTPGTVAVLVHADGTEEIVKNSVPTENGIQLTVDGSATVKIVDNSKDFIDTRNHWAKDAIDFVSARGLVNGISATIYAPNASTTRAQLWTILARQNDAELTGGATWFENAQNWAKEKGISDGTNPNGTINRAQMVTMLWRAMGQPAPATAATFTDVSADSYYAGAVSWAVENGVTTGVGGGRFDPAATCTRGQIAAFLYRYMK